MKNILLLTCLVISLASCRKDPYAHNWDMEKVFEHNKQKITVTQGLAGTLYMEEGSCMPADEETLDKYCRRYGISRTILVYEYTLKSQAEGKSPHYDSVKSKLLGKTTADEEGFFEIALSAGNYSIFIEEQGKLYAIGTDHNNAINPVDVQQGILIRNLKIDYSKD